MQTLVDFLEEDGQLIDVRSPSEYLHAHIPGALSLPLFTDEERAKVGTLYKGRGQKEAIRLGLSLVGPKLHLFAEQADQLLQGKRAKVYCFRGGMRSLSMSWLLRFVGHDVLTLKGGYKGFRGQSAHIEELLAVKHFDIHVISGLTGSGKTSLLHQMERNGEHILDLERLANHRGSAFGKLGPQPSQEMFENLIFTHLQKIDKGTTLYVEDESRLIGRCQIPKPLYIAMQVAPKRWISRPIEERVSQIEKDYSSSDLPSLLEALNSIKKRLGAERATLISTHLQMGRTKEAIVALLDYYDKSYRFK